MTQEVWALQKISGLDAPFFLEWKLRPIVALPEITTPAKRHGRSRPVHCNWITPNLSIPVSRIYDRLKSGRPDEEVLSKTKLK